MPNSRTYADEVINRSERLERISDWQLVHELAQRMAPTSPDHATMETPNAIELSNVSQNYHITFRFDDHGHLSSIDGL
jgi:hypothetical protein